MTLDRIDYRILHYLQNDARMPNTLLAEAVGLSPSPCLRRVKALEAQGVSLRSQEKTTLEKFQTRITTYPEVMECYLMTGTSDYLLRVVMPDLESYERFLVEKLTKIAGIANIQTSFALKPIVQRTELPLQAPAR